MNIYQGSKTTKQNGQDMKCLAGQFLYSIGWWFTLSEKDSKPLSNWFNVSGINKWQWQINKKHYVYLTGWFKTACVSCHAKCRKNKPPFGRLMCTSPPGKTSASSVDLGRNAFARLVMFCKRMTMSCCFRIAKNDEKWSFYNIFVDCVDPYL